MSILAILYVVVGYWAAGVVFFQDKIVFQRRLGQIFITKLILGLFLGVIVIPIAILKTFFSR